MKRTGAPKCLVLKHFLLESNGAPSLAVNPPQSKYSPTRIPSWSPSFLSQPTEGWVSTCEHDGSALEIGLREPSQFCTMLHVLDPRLGEGLVFSPEATKPLVGSFSHFPFLVPKGSSQVSLHVMGLAHRYARQRERSA